MNATIPVVAMIIALKMLFIMTASIVICMLQHPMEVLYKLVVLTVQPNIIKKIKLRYIQ